MSLALTLALDPLVSQTHGWSLLGSDQALQRRICVAAGLGELRKMFKGPHSKGKLAESEANQKNLSRGTWSVEFKEASHQRKSFGCFQTVASQYCENLWWAPGDSHLFSEIFQQTKGQWVNPQEV